MSSAFTVVNYKAAGDSTGFQRPAIQALPGQIEGIQFFAGGNAAVSTATQEIDLTANATDINAGKVTYYLLRLARGICE